MKCVRRQVLSFAVGALLMSVLAAGMTGAQATRVLFIGNSYTYFNNLPEMVRVLA